VLRDAQVTGRGVVEDLTGKKSSGAPLRVTRPGFRLGEPFPQPTPPPELGQDRALWLAALGYTEAEIEGCGPAA
jgi:crotonobetainyl-CoA:carnitine CoA-transferase CaiB-like acyl-CoA transferase